MAKRIHVHPDKKKATLILRSTEKSLKAIKKLGINEFPSNCSREYYEIIRELISVIILFDGFKYYGDGSHFEQIKYLEKHYRMISTTEIKLILKLREIRNRVIYDGFEVKKDSINRQNYYIITIINKLRNIINKRIK